MSTCQLRMAQSFHLTSLIPGDSPINKPSNLYSGLVTHFDATSLTCSTSTKSAELLPEGNGVPGPEYKKKVTVVGAGISGLRAASVLQRHGLDVVVLEARGRIGGRILTSRKGQNVIRDIGTSRSSLCLAIGNTTDRTCAGSWAEIRFGTSRDLLSRDALALTRRQR
jgi:polyamine oxidase